MVALAQSADAPPPLVAVCFCGLARAFILSEQRANLRANLVSIIRSAGFRVHAYLQTSLADHPRMADYAAPLVDRSWLDAALAELGADRSATDLTTPEVAGGHMQMGRLQICMRTFVRPLEDDERGGVPVDFVAMVRPDAAFVDPVPPPTKWSRTRLTVSRLNVISDAPPDVISDHVLVGPSTLMQAVVASRPLKFKTVNDRHGRPLWAAERNFLSYLEAAVGDDAATMISRVDGFMVAVVRVKSAPASGRVAAGLIECHRQRDPAAIAHCEQTLAPQFFHSSNNSRHVMRGRMSDVAPVVANKSPLSDRPIAAAAAPATTPSVAPSGTADAALTRWRRASNTQACTPVDEPASVAALGIAGAGLPDGARVWSCEARSAAASGMVYIEGFLSAADRARIVEQEVDKAHAKGFVKSATSNFASNVVRKSDRKRFTRLEARLDKLIAGTLGNGSATGARGVRPRLMWPQLQYTLYHAHDAGARALPNQLHHDRNFRPDRFLTFLLYLSSPSLGGHTVFPFTAASATRGEMPPRGQEHNDKLVFKDGPRYDRATALCDASLAPDRAFAAETDAETGGGRAALARLRNLSAHGQFAMAPVEGDAVVFWHWSGGSAEVPDWDHYHGACGVVEGRKLAMQAFVELPGITAAFHHEQGGGRGGCRYDEKSYALECG